MAIKKVLYVSLHISLIVLTYTTFAQLANIYPNDVGIESDTNVLYVEKFDDGMTNIQTKILTRKIMIQ